MRLLKTEGFCQELLDHLVCVDTDFLGFIFRHDPVLQLFNELAQKSSFLIDSLTEFEFMRDVYAPKQRFLRERFIKQDFFKKAPSGLSLGKSIQENALILSKIYALNNRSKGVSFVDLMLSGRIIAQKKTLILSGNKKDFPSCVFEAKGVLNFEDNGFPAPKSFWLISYNETKFDTCYQHLKKVEKLQSRELSKALEKIKI